MIPYHVFQPFDLGIISINFYGIFFALGIFIAILLAKREAKRRKINIEIIEELAIYLIIGIIIGARAFYLLFFWPQNIPFTFWDIFAVWNGGMAFFGGLIGAIISGYIFCKKKKQDFFKLLDIFTVPIIVGHIFGRVGAYLIGNQPGKIVDPSYPLAIFFEGAYRHPVELYDLIGLIIILGIILLIKNKSAVKPENVSRRPRTLISKNNYVVEYKLKKGILFSIYIILYGLQRFFIIDPLRTPATDPLYYGFTASQYLIVLLIIGAAYYLYRNYKK